MTSETLPRGGPAPGVVENGALIRARGLTTRYWQGDLEVPALRGVDLDVQEGEFTALAGPSAAAFMPRA